MNTYTKLKKEGINIIEKLDTLKVNTIALSVASKLCLAFPEHNLVKSDLFESLSRINMYIAKMPPDSSGAKYFYKNCSIYFNYDLDLEEMSKMALHECIHFIQELRDSNNAVIRMGLYNPTSNKGLAINEAAVQLMASESNMMDIAEETYFNISIKTISPNHYPLQCVLVNQIAYFTGTYPLYHSTLNSNDVFKNTFILKSDKKTYTIIVKNLDELLSLENDLNYFASELNYTNRLNTIKLLNKFINETKQDINTLFFKTQNLIIEKCFKNEFNNIRTLEDINDFNKKLYNFKNIIGYCEGYTFYNDFYRQMMNEIENKKAYIKQHGEINLFDNFDNSLMLIDNPKPVFSFLSVFINKFKKIFGFNHTPESINDWK